MGLDPGTCLRIPKHIRKWVPRAKYKYELECDYDNEYEYERRSSSSIPV